METKAELDHVYLQCALLLYVLLHYRTVARWVSLKIGGGGMSEGGGRGQRDENNKNTPFLIQT